MSILMLAIGLPALAVVGICGWWFFGDSISERLARQQFDAVKWKAIRPESTNAIRSRMVDDLLHRYSFRGMTRQEVTGLIGEPEKSGYFTNWDMVYWLGPERGFMSIDSEWLVFRLDNEKKVTDLKVLTD